MNEKLWKETDDPRLMLQALQGKGHLSKRKMRLFAVACCRRVAHRLATLNPASAAVCRHAVAIAEQYADGNATIRAMNTAHDAVVDLPPFPRSEAFRDVVLLDDLVAAGRVSDFLHSGDIEEMEGQADLLRDIFGPILFRQPVLKDAWVTPEVRDLAQAWYAEPKAEIQPILGDAFEEAGCARAEILAHLRGPHVHVRGCWLVDVILGKR